MPNSIVLTVARFLQGGSESTVESPLVLFSVHVNLIVYAMCYWMQQPVLPFLSKELGAEGIAFGFLQSTVSVFSLIGGPLFGHFNDDKGAKYALMLAQTASFAMYLLTAFAYNLPILYASRIPAIGQHAMLCSQAAITLIVSKSNKTAAIGRLSLSYGVGMVVGGPLGGFLSEHFGFRSSALLAAVFSLMMIVAIYFIVPDPPTKKESVEESSESNDLSFMAIKALLVNRVLLDVLVTSFLFSLGMGSFRTAFALAAMDTYGFSSQTLGSYISFSAVVSMVGNIFYVPGLVKYFNNNYLTVFTFSSLVCCISYFFFISASSFFMICLISVPITLSTSVMYVLSTSLISNAVDATKQGKAISLSHATRSFVGLISPIIGGFVFEKFHIVGVCATVIALLMLSTAYCQVFGRNSFKLVAVEKK